MERKDPLTGEIFIPKRNDQIFANRKNQVEYHNAKAREFRDSASNTNSKLKKNWEILILILNNESIKIVKKDELMFFSFDFTYMTRYVENTGQIFVYNIAIKELDNDNYRIVKYSSF